MGEEEGEGLTMSAQLMASPPQGAPGGIWPLWGSSPSHLGMQLPKVSVIPSSSSASFPGAGAGSGGWGGVLPGPFCCQQNT